MENRIGDSTINTQLGIRVGGDTMNYGFVAVTFGMSYVSSKFCCNWTDISFHIHGVAKIERLHMRVLFYNKHEAMLI